MNQTVYLACRGENVDDAGFKDYSGTMYWARFSSTEPITLRAVGFYGPKSRPGYFSWQKEACKKPFWIDVSLMIQKEQGQNEGDLFMPLTVIQADVKKSVGGKVFFLELPKLVSIPAHTIFKIGFVFNTNEDVYFCALSASENVPNELVIPGCNARIFSHPSSAQCAGFLFMMEDAQENHPDTSLDLAEFEEEKTTEQQNKGYWTLLINFICVILSYI